MYRHIKERTGNHRVVCCHHSYSPYALYIHRNTSSLFKYAYDMVLVELCSKNQVISEQTYFKNVVVLEDWCKLSALHINVRKTKELIFNVDSGKQRV